MYMNVNINKELGRLHVYKNKTLVTNNLPQEALVYMYVCIYKIMTKKKNQRTVTDAFHIKITTSAMEKIYDKWDNKNI